MLKRFFIILFTSLSIYGLAQNDTSKLEDVVITATRSERKLGNVAVPVSIITHKTIRQAGSVRLNDILNEQTGLFINDAGFGTAVQMQGLSADYTLILINGEPLIGRNTGVLDLKRIAVGNIDKIEIVRGPSSSLYGCEAMAGVINIITKDKVKDNLSASVRVGSINSKPSNINTFDVGIQANTSFNKVKLSLFSNVFRTELFSIRPYSVEKNLEPLIKYNNQLQINFPLDNKTKSLTQVWYNHENFDTKFSTINLGVITFSDGKEKHDEFSLLQSVTHTINNNTKTNIRFYHSQYQSKQDLATSSSSAYYDFFMQRYYKIENQTDFKIGERQSIIVGAGYIYENVKSSRYDSENNLKENKIGYGFIQDEIAFNKKFIAILGCRYDNNLNYESAFSPKASLLFKLNNKLKFNASIGAGFKAPDFRQLYLNFTNSAAGGYSVFGALEAVKQIEKLKQQGMISSTTYYYSQLKSLKPESSVGINIGITYQPKQSTQFSINFFHNNLNNLIDYVQVANYKNGAQLYSYVNIKNAYTKGIEVNGSISFCRYFTANFGYQYLLTGNKDEEEKIKKGEVYTKDATGIARVMNISEYWGLPNRSKHIVNLKLNFEKAKFYANTRLMWHSKWATQDKDGNGVLNDNDVFANGYYQVNFTAGYRFNKNISVQAGMNNINNYQDFANLPSLVERNYFLTINFN